MRFANSWIEQCWQAGVEAIKPSPKDLEHGLELHRQSLVWESYGFAPHCAPDATKVRELAEQGASAMEREDLVESQIMTRCVAEDRERAEFIAAWEAAGVTCIFQNAGEESQAVKHLIKRLANFTWLTDMLPQVFNRATRPADVERAKREHKHCLYFSANAVPMSEEWLSAQQELAYIEYFFRLGVRMMHLTYNRRNMLGDGCAEPADAGLSDFGRAAIAEMNRVGVIVDVAHSGQRTSFEAARASNRPMVISHSMCCALNEHCRAKGDDVIRAVADTGGYIGICCIPSFLGGKGDLSAFLDHLDYAIKKFGADHVAIGTDVAYSPPHANQQWAALPQLKTRPRWESFWPPEVARLNQQYNQPNSVQSLAWTNWPLFTVGLVQRGYSDSNIQQILGGNVMRVAKAVRSWQ